MKTSYQRPYMEIEEELQPGKRGRQLQNAERMILIGKIVDILSNGYISTYALAKQLKVSQATIDTYRGLADKVIADHKIDRNVILNLQIKRTYKLIEQFMEDLTDCKTIKDKTLIYNQIYKFSSHLALITGLNIETHISVDPQRLVIIRSQKEKKTDKIIVENTNNQVAA